ncbi:unnamed protein product [Auanema sp. JU1783]|nr:unnamed protein product [Auanema sp. JU1783]
MDGVLPPALGAKFIVENGSLIKINTEGIKNVAKLIYEADLQNTIEEVEFAAHCLHPKDGGLKAVDWVFLSDSINFSFWPDEGKKYDVTYNGKSYTGYFASCAAINKALDAGIPVTSAEWMAKATKEEIQKIFKADSGHDIPLLNERVGAINDSGLVLLEKWQGSFYNCVKAAGGSAQSLLRIIVENFKSFRDIAEYNGQKVAILKRAQILIADVAGALKGVDTIGEFPDLGTLTMFADYRVPQALAFLGALEYSQKLLDRLGEGKRLDNGSAEEVELRGFSIWACELIVEEIRRLKQSGTDNGKEVNAALVDMFVWVYRRQHAKEVEDKVPFHRTRCIFY